MPVIANRVKVATSTPGPGTIDLGAAESGFQSFADGGITNGQVVSYAIEDGAAWEIGTGTYTTGTPDTLSRTVIESSNSDAAINLSGNAVVFITALSGDLQNAVDMDQGVATTDSPSFAGLTATTADINGGTIDGTVIGGSTPAAGTFTTLTSDDGEVYAPGNILGTVSESSGVPTGAIIERGSNANGEYVKYADGTLICSGVGIVTPSTSTTTWGTGLYRSSNITSATWTLPSVFNSAPIATASGDYFDVIAFVRTPTTTTSVQVGLISPSNSQSEDVSILAIGRWF